METSVNLELPLIEDHNQYEINQESLNSHSKRHDSLILIQDEISAKHDKFHARANGLSYIILLTVGILYLIYGITKYKDSINHPLIKFSQDTTTSYPLPTTVACVEEFESYFNIDSIDYEDVHHNWTTMECDYTDEPQQIGSLDNLQTCLIIMQTFMYGFSKCFMIIPPANVTNMVDYRVHYVYWRKGYLLPDPLIEQHTNYSSPSYLNDQEKYQVSHAAVHLDDFLDQNKQWFPNNDYSTIVEMAFEMLLTDGHQASAFSWSQLILSLQEYTTLSNVVLKSFDVTQGIKKISIDAYSLLKCVDGNGNTYDICSKVIIQYSPKHRRNGYLITYFDEYPDYQLPDLLSGIGGILSTAQGIVGTFCSLLLLGFGVWCINFKGLAPYPSFDDNFKIRIQKLMN